VPRGSKQYNVNTTIGSFRRPLAGAGILALATLASVCAGAAEVFVSPVRAELRPPSLSETITVSNQADARMRVAVKLVEWTQDAQGNDVYQETTDLVYFPRQMEIDPQGKRQVRVGATVPGGATERAYRLYIEEQPDPSSTPAPGQVMVYFRMGVPVFVPPPQARPQAEISEATLERGKVSVQVRNAGNRHLRLLRLKLEDGAGFSREAPGWYTLAGAQKTYSLDVPRVVCRRAKSLSLALEGEGIHVDRKLDVDPARCG
jgi:fimbrial chaperone protein